MLILTALITVCFCEKTFMHGLARVNSHSPRYDQNWIIPSSKVVSDVYRLQIPKFAMEPGDVPQAEAGPTPDYPTTLQHIQPPRGMDAVRQRDVHVD